jgi:phage repressor protein C with HTH and peptisase S24 domain
MLFISIESDYAYTMQDGSVRKRLVDLITHRDPPTDLKRASLASGKNHAYLHQFVHRGTPRRLPEDVRYALAAHLGVDQSILRDAGLFPPPLDPHPNPPRAAAGPSAKANDRDDELVFVPELEISNLPEDADPARPGDNAPRWAFPSGWVQHALKSESTALRVVRVDGDAMEPAFRSGDHLLIDTDRQAPSPPGVFVIYDGVGLIPRSLEFLPNSDPPIVLMRSPSGLISDLEVPLNDVRVIGRAVWHARRL